MLRSMTRTSRLVGLLFLAMVVATVMTVVSNGHPAELLQRLHTLLSDFVH
jgi:hypothetical protein